MSKTLKKMGEVESYHFETQLKLKVLGVKPTELRLRGEWQKPDKIRMFVSTRNLTVENIFIGTKVYIKNPNTGQWQSRDAAAKPSDVANFLQNYRQPTLIREENLEGDPVFKLRATFKPELFLINLPNSNLPPESLKKAKVEGTLWIDKDEGLLRKMKAKIEDIRISATSLADIDMSVKWSQFDEPITIAPPL